MVSISSICLTMLLAFFAVTKGYAGGYAQHQVTITGFEFVPKKLHVQRGDTIVWVNHDIVPHSIVISSSQEAISLELDNGDAFTYVVESTMAYECGLHPSMKGKLLIP